MTAALKILAGNSAKWAVQFFDELGAPDDPTEVTFTLVDPAGDAEVFTYGTDVEVVRDAEGEYHIWRAPGADPETAGEFTGFFKGTGDVTARGCAVVEVTVDCE